MYKIIKHKTRSAAFLKNFELIAEQNKHTNNNAWYNMKQQASKSYNRLTTNKLQSGKMQLQHVNSHKLLAPKNEKTTRYSYRFRKEVALQLQATTKVPQLSKQLTTPALPVEHEIHNISFLLKTRVSKAFVKTNFNQLKPKTGN